MKQPGRKIHSHAVLKNLPAEHQDVILKYCEKHSYQETVKWLANNGIKSSETVLGHWRQWYLAKKAFEQREANILNRLENYRCRNPKVTNKDLDEMGEFLFNGMAIEQEDVKTWNLTQQIRLKREKQMMEKKMVGNATKKLGLELRKYKDQRARADAFKFRVIAVNRHDPNWR